MGIKEIIPLLAALIGLTPVFLKWLNDRSNEAARRRNIQQAKEQIEFWQAWLQAQREVSTEERFNELKKEVAGRLDNLMQKEIAVEPDKKDTEHKMNFFRKVLLAYFPHTASGWIFHTFYYITLSFILMFLYGSFLPTDDLDAEPSWSYFVNDLDIIIPMFLFFAAIAFGFQRLAIRSEKKYFKRTKES